jgi:hypothetical protein
MPAISSTIGDPTTLMFTKMERTYNNGNEPMFLLNQFDLKTKWIYLSQIPRIMKFNTSKMEWE